MVEVHSLIDFNASDIPKGKPPDQCLDELDNFIMKQSHFNERIQGQLHDNSVAIKSLLDVLGRTVNDVKCLVKHFHMVQTQLEQISNVQKYSLANNAIQDNLQAYGIKTRGGTHTQDPLYPEGHPKRIEQDSQVQEEEIVSSLIRPKCITILYCNSPLFIDIFDLLVLFLCCFGLFDTVCNLPVPKQQKQDSAVKSGHQVAESDHLQIR